MNLKKLVIAGALGATVLTSVPALVAPQLAAASDGCWSDYLSDCLPDDPGDPGDDGSGGGDVGGGGGGGGGIIDISDGNQGDPIPDIPVVVISGPRIVDVFTPADPGIATDTWYAGGSGGGGGSSASVWSQGKKWKERQNCYSNTSDAPTKLTKTVQYQWGIKVSANLSAKAKEVLTATLGTEVNVQFTDTQSVEITLNPGQTWAMEVEYQTSVYQITTSDVFGNYTNEYVNVTQPTGVVNAVACQ